MKKIILTIVVLLIVIIRSQAQYHYRYVKSEQEQRKSHEKHIAKHQHDPETPDPAEEARELKRRQNHARKERSGERLEKDKENLKYEKKRRRSDSYSGTYEPISKAGVKQHRRKLKEDRKLGQ